MSEIRKMTEANNIIRRATRLSKLIHLGAPSIIVAHELRFVTETIARIAEMYEGKPGMDELNGYLGEAAVEAAKKYHEEYEVLPDDAKEGRYNYSLNVLEDTVQDIEKIMDGTLLGDKG